MTPGMALPRLCGRVAVGALAAAALLAFLTAATAGASAGKAAPVYPPALWQTTIDHLLHADVVKSVTLPGGRVLWVFGDTLEVNGMSTHYANGYPHDSFVLQKPGTLDFSMVHGPYGFGYQQVPNWPDGSYFWNNVPIVDGGTLYVIGERILRNQNWEYLGEYMAEFDATNLRFEKVVPAPGGPTGFTQWSGVAKGAHGWFISGAHTVRCAHEVDCAVGDIAWVPFGDLPVASDWSVNADVVPARFDLGSSIAILRLSASSFVLFTKRGDAGTHTIEELACPTIYGPWTVTGAWTVVTPPNSAAYSVGDHPEQAAPPGKILVSYGVDGIGWDGFGAGFLYAPVTAATPRTARLEPAGIREPEPGSRLARITASRNGPRPLRQSAT
jgi:hypothetical protein